MQSFFFTFSVKELQQTKSWSIFSTRFLRSFFDAKAFFKTDFSFGEAWMIEDLQQPNFQ